jgi:hypothetical protein
MASGDTDVIICSEALQLLGSTSITSFSDGSTAGSLCNTLYPRVKATALGMYPWSFSLKKVQLSESSGDPTTYWANSFTLPSDMVNGVPRKVFTSNSSGADNLTDYEIQGSELLTQETTIYVDYQATVAEGSMPSYFVTLLVYMMAWHLAEPVTDQITKADYWKNVALGSALESLRGGYFRQATAIDGAGQSTQVLADYVLVDVR